MKEFRISEDFRDLFKDIEVSESNYEKIITRYESVAEHIHESDLSKYNPDIYLQGSIKLGTAIKPITENGSYDVDIVCNFENLSKLDISQKELKRYLYQETLNYTKIHSMKNKPEESKRCWTINYVDDQHFHIDILPSLPWDNSLNTNIAITDTTNDSYEQISNDWEISNPKGYAEWFRDIEAFQLYKQEYSNEVRQSIEKIPDYKVKTTLQRIIQLLKRHAEVYFVDRSELKPSSIIITTLAAMSYKKFFYRSNDFEELLLNIVRDLPSGIHIIEGRPQVVNPVNADENLSIKWKEEKYFNAFKYWQESLLELFNVANYQTRSFHLQSIKNSMFLEVPEFSEVDLDTLSHHKEPEWPMHDNLPVKIITEYKPNQKGFRYKKILSNEKLNRDGSLKFTLQAENLKQYDIFWQITNTGREAEKANGLRGDFYESELVEGKRVRTESTLYIGTHYVEAYIVKNGICYGKSKPFIVKIVKDISFDWLKK